MSSPVCGVCDSGYFSFNDNCYRCGVGTGMTRAGMISILAVVYIIFLGISIYVINKKATLDDEQERIRLNENTTLYGQREITRTVKLLISYLQVLILNFTR